MTPFFKQSITRALCAAAWCLPGALLWAATPALAASTSASGAWRLALPDGGFRCGSGTSARALLQLSLDWGAAVERGEAADSLLAIAVNPGMSARSRWRARKMLAASGEPRVQRFLARHPMHELPPLIVRSSP